MLTSPFLHIDDRGRSKRPKRAADLPTGRKNENDDYDDDENDDEMENYDNSESPSTVCYKTLNPNVAAAAAAAAAPEVLADGGVLTMEFPRVVRYDEVNTPHSMIAKLVEAERASAIGESGSVLSLENVSYGQLQVVSAMPRAEAGPSDGPCVITPPQITECRGVAKQFCNGILIVPMHSDWFDPSTVNRLERQGVPQLFSGTSTVEKYMECRNYIVAKYMENPWKTLVVSDCQGLVNAITSDDLNRLVRFLDHWGIINYRAIDPPCEDFTNGPYIREDHDNVVHVSSEALKSIDCLIKFDKPKCSLKVAASDLENRIEEQLSENCCSCCSQPILLVYYQSQKEVDVLICCDCFHDGKFVAGHSSIDFLKMGTSKDYVDQDGENWSDQETFLLLEAVEKYHENWIEIAEHVGTKSKAQCIVHFLRLPIEDILDNVKVPKPNNSINGDVYWGMDSNSNGDILGSHLLDAELEINLPFANSGNPIMSLVTFLATAVGPRVAATCAHECLAVMSREMEGPAHNNRINVESMDGREGSSPVSDEIVKAAVKAGLAAAATKAKLFADHEEREIQRLSANIINHQLKRLELKLKLFAEVETTLMKDCEQADRTRQRFASDRARFEAPRLGNAGIASRMNPLGANLSMVNNNFSNNKQPVISASTSQLSISGHEPTNQTGQPQMMTYMQQQPMFQSGPRYPFGSMQGSSSNNVMFNTPGNSQPGLNHLMLRSLSGSSPGNGVS